MISRLRVFSMLATALVTTGAIAGTQYQSAALCQAEDPDATKVAISSNGIVAESTVRIYCPLLRQTTSALDVVTLGFSRVTDGTSCSLFAKEIDGTSSDSVTLTVDTSPFNYLDNQERSFDLSGLSEGTEKVYTLRCDLEEVSTFLPTLTGVLYTE